MGRNRFEERNIRRLGKIGSAKNHSYYITLPIEAVREMGWRGGQKLVIKKLGRKQKLVIEAFDN